MKNVREKELLKWKCNLWRMYFWSVNTAKADALKTRYWRSVIRVKIFMIFWK